HATALAKEVGFPTVLIPEVPGVFSAYGLLIADIRHDFVRSHVTKAGSADLKVLDHYYSEMETLAEEAMAQDAIDLENREFIRTADVRYVGQAYEVNVPLPVGPVSAELVSGLIEKFHAEHQRQFAHSSPEDPVEIVNLRLVAIGRVQAPELQRPEVGDTSPEPTEHRQVYFESFEDFVACPIYDRAGLTPGTEIEGPVIVEQLDCTTVVHPGQRLTVDEWGNLAISLGAE
ncbi:unnamed protein product, partial [Laminaria digitata]